MSPESKTKIPVRDDEGNELGNISASVVLGKASRVTVVLAHGAGGTMDSASIVSLQSRLASGGMTAVRFNFLYSEKGKKSPDRQSVLVACWRSVADWVKKEHAPRCLVLAGRSMGGRIASHLVAEGYSCDGLVLLAYPLHPPGRRDRQRREHLANVEVPMLFLSGTRDNFAYLDFLEPLVKEIGAQLHLIEGGDHGFKVPNKLGTTAKDVEEDVASTVFGFIESLMR